MLALLLEVPKNADEWARWSFHHRLQHDAIRQAIQTQKGVNTNAYILDPVNFNSPKDFLERNQETHNEMNAPLGLQGSDLEDVNLSDARELEAWVYAEYQELFSASQALGI